MKNLKEIIRNDYFKLFVKREGKVVLGKRYASLWLLCSVLTATFLAIAFSNASLDYLAYKMNDPFVNWVDIVYQPGGSFELFKQDLESDELKKQFHYSGHQADIKHTPAYWTTDENNEEGSYTLNVRYFEKINSRLVQAILDDENVVNGQCVDNDALCDDSWGVIVTQDALQKLGYKGGNAPAYLYLRSATDRPAVDDYGAELAALDDEDDMMGYAKAPIPVLAVVHRLPGNFDMIATTSQYDQHMARSLSFDNRGYHSSFYYYVPKNVDAQDVINRLETLVKQSTDESYYPNANAKLPRMVNHRGGTFVKLVFDDEDRIDFMVNRKINQTMLAEFARDGVERVYFYDDRPTNKVTDDFISIYFADLNEIRPFAEYVKEQYKIVIEMSQVTAKENFNEVSIMANFLSWTMIVFAIICILLFIINLLQSYFQKVKRNLGTFKAFGLSNYELITIYVLIMIATIFAAVVISLLVTLLIQELLPLLGIVKDGSFGYLSLGSSKTFYSVLIIIVASVYTVYEVMHNLLKATPGDLIYDR